MDAQHELERVAQLYVEAAVTALGDRLRAAVLFGSVARGEATDRSDVDILLVATELPEGRLARARSLELIDDAVEPEIASLRRRGLQAEINPIWKTPAEAERVTPLYLDLTEDARLLLDRDGLIDRTLSRLRARLAELGSKRERIGAARIWHLKPDASPGEEIVL
jgi:predicted nucleotidyltransferase